MLALIDMYKAPQKNQDIVVMNKELIPCLGILWPRFSKIKMRK